MCEKDFRGIVFGVGIGAIVSMIYYLGKSNGCIETVFKQSSIPNELTENHIIKPE